MKNILLIIALLVSTKVTAQWQNCKPGSIVTTMAFAGGNLFIGDFLDGVFYSTDNGNSWIPKNNGLTIKNMTGLMALNTDLFGTLWSNGGIVKSDINGGSAWTSSNNGIPVASVSGIAYANNTLFATIFGGGVVRSTDNGNSWSFVNNGLSNTYATSVLAKGTLVFVGTYAGVYRTSDNGTLWEPKSTGLPLAGIRTLASDGTHLYAGTTVGIYRSADDGENWVSVNVGLPNLDVTAVAANQGMLVIGATGAVYVSFNKGASWQNITGNIIPNYNMNVCAINNNDLFVGSGSGFWRRSLGSITNVNEPGMHNGLTCYPTKSKGHFLMTGLPATLCQLEVFDCGGKKVLHHKILGGNTEFDLNGRSAGLYFYKVTGTEAGAVRGKIILE